MVESSSAPGPGVIVIAERPLADLLSSQDIGWVVQERQPSIGAMWDALSGGQLDQRSRILVFSDSLQAGSGSEEAELVQTARAIVAMSNAGAHVFMAVWRPSDLPHLRELIEEAAEAQGLATRHPCYHFLPVGQGGRAVLESMRRCCSTRSASRSVTGPSARHHSSGGVHAVAVWTGLPVPVVEAETPDEIVPDVIVEHVDETEHTS